MHTCLFTRYFSSSFLFLLYLLLILQLPTERRERTLPDTLTIPSNKLCEPIMHVSACTVPLSYKFSFTRVISSTNRVWRSLIFFMHVGVRMLHVGECCTRSARARANAHGCGGSAFTDYYWRSGTKNGKSFC